MAKLTARQVASAAYQAGFRQPALAVAVSVAYAESGFDPAAKNPTSTATGLWQILASHEEFKGWDLTDPATNAKAAYQLYSESGWAPWASSKGSWSTKEGIAVGVKGSALPDKGLSALANSLLPGDPVPQDPGAAIDAVVPGNPVAAVKTGTDVLVWLADPANWQRIVFVGVGAAMLIIGLNIVARPVTAPVVSAVKKTAGAAGKLAAVAA